MRSLQDQFYPDSMVLGGGDGRCLAFREDDTESKEQAEDVSVQPERGYHLGAAVLGQMPAEQILGMQVTAQEETAFNTDPVEEGECPRCGGLMQPDPAHPYDECMSCGYEHHWEDGIVPIGKREAVAVGERYMAGITPITVTEVGDDGMVYYQYDPGGGPSYSMSVEDFEALVADTENPFQRAAGTIKYEDVMDGDVRKAAREAVNDRLDSEDDEYMLDTNARKTALQVGDRVEHHGIPGAYGTVTNIREEVGGEPYSVDVDWDATDDQPAIDLPTLVSNLNKVEGASANRRDAPPVRGGRAEADGLRQEAGNPDWLHERVNDPYGTPPNHEFWSTVTFEEIGPYRVFGRDGTWYAHHQRQNYWMTLVAGDAASAREEVEGMDAGLDMWASRHAQFDDEHGADGPFGDPPNPFEPPEEEEVWGDIHDKGVPITQMDSRVQAQDEPEDDEGDDAEGGEEIPWWYEGPGHDPSDAELDYMPDDHWMNN